ncbi:hypothetical protein QAD02_006771 [Eretmocerus hayati]|uniref:Uncharacterized protein n=1 Tax=Eretmocerus hayati TaxID=131215 RepID=A0ACC2N1U0_9HYME|nr:hypothetical protein QAD02_006771 [Eretmocerus hayati]
MLLFSVILTTDFRGVAAEKCYNPKSDFYPFMNAKTAYEYVHATVGRPESTCQPVQIWMLARHGTRYPDADKILQLKNLTKIRDEILGNDAQKDIDMCEKDLAKLKDWNPDENMNSSNDEMLTPQGEKDLIDLAHRLKSVFSDLITEDHSAEDYVFRSTKYPRALDSMTAFSSSMFPDTNVTYIEPPENDTLLLLHENCPAWINDFKENDVVAEMNIFKNGPEVQNVLENVSSRLGYKSILDYKTVNLMYEMCIYETAWNVQDHIKNDYVSPWCLVFTKEELQVLEYVKDLDYFYCCGPGRRMSKKIGCNPLVDMFHNFEKLESSDEYSKKGTFYFAHSQTVQTFLAALDFSIDSPPMTSKNYDSQKNRSFRSSIQGSFASNFFAVFYRCSGVEDQDKVMMYVGEKAITPKGCTKDLCSWKYIKKQLSSTVENCGTKFCYATAGASQLDHGFKYILGLIMSLSFLLRMSIVKILP